MKRSGPITRTAPLVRKALLRRGVPLREMSAKRRQRLQPYWPVREAYLRTHRWCVICPVRGRRPNPATEVHHIKGRSGDLLTDTRFFAASCRYCRDWPHDNPNAARAANLA